MQLLLLILFVLYEYPAHLHDVDNTTYILYNINCTSDRKNFISSVEGRLHHVHCKYSCIPGLLHTTCAIRDSDVASEDEGKWFIAI
jgi:hypothetical protein